MDNKLKTFKINTRRYIFETSHGKWKCVDKMNRYKKVPMWDTSRFYLNYNIILLRVAMAIAIRLLSSDIIILFFRDLMLQMLVSYFMIFENESIFDSDSIFYKSTG